MEAAKAFVTYELSISHLYKNADRIASVMATPEVWYRLQPSSALHA